MKASEFIKMVGWGEAKSILEAKSFTYRQLGLFSYINHDLGNLKRLVESHELIESCGGLEQAKAYAIDANACGAFNDELKLKQAITDMESCQ